MEQPLPSHFLGGGPSKRIRCRARGPQDPRTVSPSPPDARSLRPLRQPYASWSPASRPTFLLAWLGTCGIGAPEPGAPWLAFGDPPFPSGSEGGGLRGSLRARSLVDLCRFISLPVFLSFLVWTRGRATRSPCPVYNKFLGLFTKNMVCIFPMRRNYETTLAPFRDSPFGNGFAFGTGQE